MASAFIKLTFIGGGGGEKGMKQNTLVVKNIRETDMQVTGLAY